MKDKIGIIVLIISALILVATIVLGHFQTEMLAKDSKEISTKIEEVQSKIDEASQADDTISNTEAINVKSLADNIASTQGKIIKYYPKMVTGKLTDKETITVSSLCDSFYSQVNVQRNNDINLFVDYMWYYNPNFKAVYEASLNYAPGKIFMLWKIYNGEKLAGIVIGEYDSETQLISGMKSMLNEYGAKENTNFKGYPKEEIKADEQEKPDSIVQKEQQEQQEQVENQKEQEAAQGTESDAVDANDVE